MQTNGQEDRSGGGTPNPEKGGREERRLAAIMFTDITGYSRMVQTNESVALSLLAEHRGLLRPILTSYGGVEIETIGDAFLVEFRSALDAVRCAIRVQESLAQRNAESTSLRQIQVRIGIHVGDVVHAGSDVYGDTVNLASRIESVAEPGGITISSQVFEQVRNKITIPIELMGEFMLKNITAPYVLYKIQPLVDQQKLAKETFDPRRRFAVLPLVSIGQSDEYLADGLTEELISAFSRVPMLKVVARTTTMRYKGSSKSISLIGRELNVSTILEGSVRRSGNRFRITVQLIETSTEEYLWSENYDCRAEDILDIQNDVAAKTVEALRSKVGGYEKAVQLVEKRSDHNPDAFLAYLKGRFHLARHTEAEVKIASDLFDNAIRLDPNFAAAYAMSAQCFMFLAFFGFITPEEGFQKTLPALRRAIQIDNDLDIGHMLMGRLLQDRWDWRGAEAEFRRAIEISPNNAEAHYRYALLLNDMKRTSEALGQVKLSEELDPLSVPVCQIAGTIMLFAGKHRDAIERFQRALEIEPRAALAQDNLGLAHFEEGNIEKGISEVRKALELDPKNMMFRVDLCYLLSRAGDKKEVHDILSETEALAKTQHVSPVALAGMYSSLGENENAIGWLEKAYLEHSPYLGSLGVEKWFDRIRKEPRFIALLEKMGIST